MTQMVDLNVTWTREADPGEYFAELAHQRGTFLICYQLSLTTREPLQEAHVTEALTHLYRKVPCLRVYYDERNGTNWFREATHPNIDFKVLPGNDASSVIDCLRTYRYNSTTGPLWCARLMSDVSSHKTSPILPDDSSVSFPHLHQLFLGFHHGIVDGFTVMKICGLTVTLLNDVISGNPINNEQLGEHVSPKQTMELVLARKALIEADPELRKKWVDETKILQEKKSFFNQIYQRPKEIEEKSLHVERELDESTTKRFFNTCRAEGVTVHSAFTALTNEAFIDLLVENGIVQDTYSICNGHLVNMRRYWKGDVSRSLGCHILYPVLLRMDTLRNISDTFWDFARSVHQELQRNIKDGKIIEAEAFRMINNVKIELDLDSLPADGSDYHISNMGDVTALVTEGGDHVKVTRLLRSISIHKMPSSCSHIIHSFRGKFMYVLDYNTRNVSTEIADNFCNKVFSNLLKVI
ncbi:uncharacterized protein [Cherax quadricarinatus]